MRHGRFDLVRYRADDVAPLEVWNLPLQGGLFWELVGSGVLDRERAAGKNDAEISKGFAEVVAEAIALLSARHPFERVFVAGGLTDLFGFRSQLQQRCDKEVSFAKSGQFAFEHGGRELLGGAEGVVLDVGQTAVKALAGSKRTVKPRPKSLQPLYIGQPRPSSQRHVDEAIELIGSAFSAVPASEKARANIVLALPCPLNDALEPGGCTYGWEEAKDLVARIFSALEARGRVEGPGRGLLLNDAELAAESARALGVKPKALVLTLGFGPGGALLG